MDAIANAIVSSWNDDRTMQEIWGWNFPALTRHDLAFLATRIANRLREVDPDEVDASIAVRVKAIPGQVSTLQQSTVPQLFNGNGTTAAPILITTLASMERILEPLLIWRAPDPNTLPVKLVRRMRTMSAQLDEIDPNKDELKAKIDLIAQATEAAENLPVDLKELESARKRVEKAANETEASLKLVKQNESQSSDALGLIAAKKLEADALVGNCEEAYRITTTKGLSASFQQRATSLGWSLVIWVILLCVALTGGAVIGYHRIEVLTKALVAERPAVAILWLQFALSALSVGAPLWFAWLATKQIGQRFRLAEDYAFKASVAKAYEGYRREAARIDPEFERQLFASALERLDEAPLRLVEEASHGGPWAELMDSKVLGKALDRYPEMKQKMLDTANEALKRFRAEANAVKPSEKVETPEE